MIHPARCEKPDGQLVPGGHRFEWDTTWHQVGFQECVACGRTRAYGVAPESIEEAIRRDAKLALAADAAESGQASTEYVVQTATGRKVVERPSVVQLEVECQERRRQAAKPATTATKTARTGLARETKLALDGLAHSAVEAFEKSLPPSSPNHERDLAIARRVAPAAPSASQPDRDRDGPLRLDRGPAGGRPGSRAGRHRARGARQSDHHGFFRARRRLNRVRIALKRWPGIWRHPDWIVDQFLLHLRRRGCATLRQAVQAVCSAQTWDFQIGQTETGDPLVEVQSLRFDPRVTHHQDFPDVPIHG